MGNINYEIGKNPIYKDGLVTFEAVEKERGGQNTIVRTLTQEQFEDFEGMARWLLQQDFQVVERADKKKKFNISYHIETLIDSLSGVEYEQKVFDSVSPNGA